MELQRAMRAGLLAICSAVIAFGWSMAAPPSFKSYSMSDCTAVIPPEICGQFDIDVMSGARPTFYVLKQEDIWLLRENPYVGAEKDFIWPDFGPDKLSTTQLDIVRNWAALSGTPLYFTDRNYKILLTISDLRVNTSDSTGEITRGHPIATDVKDLRISCEDAVERGLPSTDYVAISSQSGACLGYFSHGERRIYFDLLYSLSGRDVLRFTLNLRQWLLGLRVPGAADVSIRGPVIRQPAIDVLVMQDGDVISGKLLTSSLRLESEYGALVLDISEIYEIAILDTATYLSRVRLRNGDVIHGTLLDTEIRFEFAATGQVLTIPLEEIKYIYVSSPG